MEYITITHHRGRRISLHVAIEILKQTKKCYKIPCDRTLRNIIGACPLNLMYVQVYHIQDPGCSCVSEIKPCYCFLFLSSWNVISGNSPRQDGQASHQGKRRSTPTYRGIARIFQSGGGGGSHCVKVRDHVVFATCRRLLV